MWTLLKKEISSFFNSQIAYIVIGIFLLFSGLMFWVYPDTNILDYGYAEMGNFFNLSPFLFLFFIPAITMRMFSEEIKSGTIELLFTKPISVAQIVLAKYFAALFIVFIGLLPTSIYYISLYKLGNPVGNIDSAAVIGSYFGLFLLGAVYVSVGLFSSSLTKNQAIAFLISAVFCYILFIGFEQFSTLFSGGLSYVISTLGFELHYNSMGRGLLDSRDLIYFISVIVLFLFLSIFSLQRLRK